MTRGAKEPTWTSLVLAALRGCDGFMDYEHLRVALGQPKTEQTGCRLSAACIHLRNRRAIDCVVNPDGRAWWFALPPEEDNRTRRVDERTPERRPRNRKRKVRVYA